MAYPQTSFRDLLYSLARDAGLNPDPALNAGTSDVSTATEHLLLHYLQEATNWAWREYTVYMALPCTVTNGTQAVVDGVIAGGDDSVPTGYTFTPGPAGSGQIMVTRHGVQLGYLQIFDE